MAHDRTATGNDIESARQFAPVILILIGWLALYAPVYSEFAVSAWRRDENAHAPIMLAICGIFLFAGIRNLALHTPAPRLETVSGMVVLTAGLCAFAFGRVFEIDFAVSASQILVATGSALAIVGAQGAKRLWFPLCLMMYLIILPGWMIDAATGPLKLWISETVSNSLFLVGLPVANTGAVISAGPYELLVAQACSGVNSLIALTSVGVIYLRLANRKSKRTILAVAASLIPIAIVANLVRVLALVLITYFGGYDAGQGFMHHAAGLMMFALALGGVFLVDQVSATAWERT